MLGISDLTPPPSKVSKLHNLFKTHWGRERRSASHVINPRRACAARVTVVVVSVCLCVCVCVCLSAKSHFTLEASLLSENAVTYSVGDQG